MVLSFIDTRTYDLAHSWVKPDSCGGTIYLSRTQADVVSFLRSALFLICKYRLSGPQRK